MATFPDSELSVHHGINCWRCLQGNYGKVCKVYRGLECRRVEIGFVGSPLILLKRGVFLLLKDQLEKKHVGYAWIAQSRSMNLKMEYVRWAFLGCSFLTLFLG